MGKSLVREAKAIKNALHVLIEVASSSTNLLNLIYYFSTSLLWLNTTSPELWPFEGAHFPSNILGPLL